jgi:hypothetical protein
LLADGHLNVEISPALAKRKRRLRDPDIVGDLVARADGVVAERLRDLEKAGNDVIAVLLIGGNKAVFAQENRIITKSVCFNALRRGGLLIRREAENDLGIVCGDDLEAFAAAPIEDVVVVALSAPPFCWSKKSKPNSCSRRGVTVTSGVINSFTYSICGVNSTSWLKLAPLGGLVCGL